MQNLIITKRFFLPVTRRYEIFEQITKCYFTPGVTRRFKQQISSAAEHQHLELKINSRIADTFTILKGPLGATSGEADIYACKDEHNNTIVAIKLYRHHTKPKQKVIQQLQGLVHPNIVNIMGSGQWKGQFYEVMELYQGGVLSDHMPFNEAQLKQYLGNIIEGINYCHQQGIIHRDIKPNNLFFKNSHKKTVLIGDFGISSYSDNEQTSTRVTTTSTNLTLDYAAPELLDGHSVGPKTDYYALGITLIHLLLGQSPFTGLSSNDILVAHLRGRISQIENLLSEKRISKEFQQLLSGLLLYKTQHRWGYQEIVSWLQGKPVQLKNSTLFDSSSSGLVPYPGYRKAKNPKQLAAVLQQFNAERQLFRGDIRRWVSDHFDTELAEKIAELEIKYTEYPSKALVKLRYLLDPEQALEINNKPIKTIQELLPVLIDTPELLYQCYRNEEIAAWIKAGNLANERTSELLFQLESIRKRLPYNKKAALIGLLYTLDPHRTIKLGNYTIKHPDEIKTVYLKANSEQDKTSVLMALQKAVFSLQLEEWIRAAQFDNWQKTVSFLESCRAYYLGNQAAGIQCALWHFYPEHPFSFAGRETSKPAILALLIDQYREQKQAGLELMKKGLIRAWLVGTGKIIPGTEYDQLMNEEKLTPAAKLEITLRLMNPEFKPPKIALNQAVINFGVLNEDEEQMRTVTISNSSRGELSGEISLKYFDQGISLNKFNLDGNETLLTISINTLGLAPSSYTNKVKLTTNGGNENIVIKFIVRETIDDRVWWQKLIDD
jgi:serine/threonine protein kinase